MPGRQPGKIWVEFWRIIGISFREGIKWLRNSVSSNQWCDFEKKSLLRSGLEQVPPLLTVNKKTGNFKIQSWVGFLNFKFSFRYRSADWGLVPGRDLDLILNAPLSGSQICAFRRIGFRTLRTGIEDFGNPNFRLKNLSPVPGSPFSGIPWKKLTLNLGDIQQQGG